MSSLVTLDIETTGLDSSRDAIIEIGAVRFNGKRVEGEWESLINPNRKIPALVTQLTGITDDMVNKAPPLHAVLPELADFIGNAPVIGHNVQFDLSFLQPHHILSLNEVLDTYELAAVLMPSAGRYNLSALAMALGIPRLDKAHRALSDARVTCRIFSKLYQKATELPTALLDEFVRLSEPFDWGAAWVFRQALNERLGREVDADKERSYDTLLLFRPAQQVFEKPLTAAEQPQPLDPEEIAALMGPGGPFAHYFPAYEQRSQQIEMLHNVSRALSESRHLMVEAGTGTGKSFAYLLPTALWATQNGMRVVISTNTINLQDQLINKDIPDLRLALDLQVNAAVLKGRANYLCPRRLELLRQRRPDSIEEMRVLGKVLVWLYEGGDGDRTQINLTGAVEQEIWNRLSAQDEGCSAETCLSRTGGVCPFYQAHQASHAAHLIIVNHALLLADVATGNRVLPNYDYLIVDEAHHLESATTNALSVRITPFELSRLLKELGGVSGGVFGHLLSLFKDVVTPSEFAALNQAIRRATDLSFHFERDLKTCFQAIHDFLSEQREGNPISPYGQQERILPATRTLPLWNGVEQTWATAEETLKLLLGMVSETHKRTGEIKADIQDELEDTLTSIAGIHRRLSEIGAHLNDFVYGGEGDFGQIHWAEINAANGQLSLHIAPLHIGPLMETYLWHEKASMILTSATLTTAGSFKYLRQRLNADEADELALGSPFDYETAALLYLVNDIPEPSDGAAYQHSVEQTLIRLSKATGGRLMALFTSYAQLKRTSQAITPALADASILVYEQGEGASANMLLESFREADQAVLLGTRAFWEGVDIPGAALSTLVITKLPFDVPTDPIIAARAETFDDPFTEFSLPEAILRFRQGFGRLIRTQSDRGVVVLLDRRIMTKRYGKAFLDSIPQCTRKVGSMHELPAIAARWLNL